MRKSALAIASLTILPFAVLGAVLAQEGVPQPGARGQAPPAGRAGGPPTGMQTIPLTPQPPAGNEALYRQQVSYVLGRQFGSNLRDNEIVLDQQALLAGLSDGLTNAKAKWTDAELMAVMQRFSQEMQQKGEARMKQMVDKNVKAEADFLAKNKAAQGVQTTASGLQYKVIQQGKGPSPTLTDTVRCNYRGVLLDGTEFDASQKRGGPAEFPVRGVIPGWTEALQKMKVGDKWQLFVPSKLAYDMNPPDGAPIEPGSMLIFEIELVAIK